VLTHALCWIHAERVLAKLLGFNEPQREALASVRSELWAIYDALKAYKEAPDALTAAAIEARFEKLPRGDVAHADRWLVATASAAQWQSQWKALVSSYRAGRARRTPLRRWPTRTLQLQPSSQLSSFA
jgi:hypothetical protein